MYSAEYFYDSEYSKNLSYPSLPYFHLKTIEELPEEGVLEGEHGAFRFVKIQDGYSIYDSTLLTSGFVYPGSADDVHAPGTINGVPVTELHQTLPLKSSLNVAVEHENLKRVFLTIKNNRLRQDADLGNFSVNFRPYFCGSSKQVEYCSIGCLAGCNKLLLNLPAAKTIRIDAVKIEIEGSIPDVIENISFSGKMYPGPCYERFKTNFSNLKKLKCINGSLSGDEGLSFNNCTSLEHVHLSNGIRSIPTHAFRNCASLLDLYVPDTVIKLGEGAFENSGIETIHLPREIGKIPSRLFYGCHSLRKCFLSDSILSIESEAFEDCWSLSSPWIPAGIESIGDRAFYNCRGITSVFLPESLTQIGEDAFGGCPQLTIKAKAGSFAEQYAKESGINFSEV